MACSVACPVPCSLSCSECWWPAGSAIRPAIAPGAVRFRSMGVFCHRSARRGAPGQEQPLLARRLRVDSRRRVCRWHPRVRCRPAARARLRGRRLAYAGARRIRRVLHASAPERHPDASQYNPAFYGLSSWQLYHGEGYSAQIDYRFDEWTHVKIVISAAEARSTSTPMSLCW